MRLVLLALLVLAPMMTAPGQDSLVVQIELPREVPAGQRIPIQLRVENVSGRALDLYLRGREIAFDVTVSRAQGETVWRRLEGEIIPAIVQVKSLAPRETLELRAEWNQRTNRGQAVGPGLYAVRGALLTESGSLETAPVQLRIHAQ
jgi:hypothetical protein